MIPRSRGPWHVVVACAAFVMSARAASAQAPTAPPPPAIETDRPLRRGFTLEVGVGTAFTHVAAERRDARSAFGFAPISIGVGAFLTPKLAILAREAGTTYFDKNARGESTQFLNLTYGAHLQYWANDVVSLSAGPALAVYGENPLLSSGDVDVGFGGSARVGFALLALKHHVLRLSWETFNSKIKSAFLFGAALTVEWQYF